MTEYKAETSSERREIRCRQAPGALFETLMQHLDLFFGSLRFVTSRITQMAPGVQFRFKSSQANKIPSGAASSNRW